MQVSSYLPYQHLALVGIHFFDLFSNCASPDISDFLNTAHLRKFWSSLWLLCTFESLDFLICCVLSKVFDNVASSHLHLTFLSEFSLTDIAYLQKFLTTDQSASSKFLTYRTLCNFKSFWPALTNVYLQTFWPTDWCIPSNLIGWEGTPRRQSS